MRSALVQSSAVRSLSGVSRFPNKRPMRRLKNVESHYRYSQSISRHTAGLLNPLSQ